MALVCDSGARRKGARDSERRELEDGRRIATADRILRSGAELVYWGTGNAAGDFYAGDRNDGTKNNVNLYTASVVALDPDTGKLRWHFQEIPNDVWDFDSAYECILMDRAVNGQMRKLLVDMNKSGVTFVLDRVTGEFVGVFTVPEVQTWISGVTEDGKLAGRREPEFGKTINFCPTPAGAKSWNEMAYSPRTGFIYTPTLEICVDITAERQAAEEGRFFMSGGWNLSCPRIAPRTAMWMPGTR